MHKYIRIHPSHLFCWKGLSWLPLPKLSLPVACQSPAAWLPIKRYSWQKTNRLRASPKTNDN